MYAMTVLLDAPVAKRIVLESYIAGLLYTVRGPDKAHIGHTRGIEPLHYTTRRVHVYYL